jgi:predicted DNA binding CopG/RHH family protein
MTKTRSVKPVKEGKPIPRFKSVAEESSFWDRHSVLDIGAWEVVPYDQVCKELESRAEAKQPVTFRLEKALVRKLKDAARHHGIKYQALAREILWQSLSKKAE